MFLKDISVIIPCFNESKTIANVIGCVCREFDAIDVNYELIVVDNNSSDGSDIIAKKNGAIVFYSDSKTVAGVRNDGASISNGKVLIFLDADIEVGVGWGLGVFNVCKDILKNENAIYGSHPCVPDSVHPILYFWYQGISKDARNTHLGTGHMIVSRMIFSIIGGFDINLVTGEDFDFCRRAKEKNISIISIPQLEVFHHGYPESFMAFVKREVWHGLGDCTGVKSFFKSKVSVASSVFLMLHFIFLLFLFFDIKISLLSFLGIFSVIFSVSFYKFGFDDFKSFACVNITAYFYLLGRGVSPLYRLVSKMKYK